MRRTFSNSAASAWETPPFGEVLEGRLFPRFANLAASLNIKSATDYAARPKRSASLNSGFCGELWAARSKAFCNSTCNSPKWEASPLEN
jgi:hypothetical protein